MTLCILRFDCKLESPGWTWHIYRQGSAEYMFGFRISKICIFWVLLTTAVFFGLLDKCCIFKCFIFLTVFLGPVSCTWYFSNHGSPYRYCLTKISIRAKRSISRVFSLFIVPSPFFVHCPYKGRINRAESVLTGLKPY